MKISIVIPTTNRKEELRKSIDAYLSQTYQNFEILIMDNASTDGTRDMINTYYENDERIKHFYFNENLYFTAFNIGVWNSTGEIIWVCDDDSNPRDNDAFERIVNIFHNHQNIHIIGTEDIEVLSNNRIWQWHPFDVNKTNIPEDGYKTNTFHGTGAAVRKEVFDKIGAFWGFGFEENDFCTRAIVAGFNIRYFPNIVTLHFNSTKVRIREDRWIQMSTQFVKYNFKYFPFFKATLRVFLTLVFEILKAIYFRFSLLAILTAIYSWKYHSLYMRFKDFHPIPKNKVIDVTLGVSPNINLLKYLKFKFINK